jgi:hypothetical protein
MANVRSLCACRLVASAARNSDEEQKFSSFVYKARGFQTDGQEVKPATIPERNAEAKYVSMKNALALQPT